MPKDLIVFGEDWQRHPSSSQHVVTQLAAYHRVLWVNSIGLRQPRLSLKDGKRIVEKLFSMVKARLFSQSNQPKSDLPQALIVLSPIVFPAPQSSLLRALNRQLLKWQVNRVAKRMGLQSRALWIALPTAVDIVGHLQEDNVIYYCGDDFSALAGVDHQHVTACEKELAAKANHILVASEKLSQKFSKLGYASKTAMLPHGVDFDLFSKPAALAANLCKEQPVAGFYGSIASWLDLDLIAKAARRLPNWRFVFIGNIQTDVSMLRSLPNIEFLPAVEHSVLPQYVQHWTISMLPFRQCSQIRSCDPLKLREYLAAGRPIVSTDFPALRPYTGLITVVDDVEDFVNALLKADQSSQDLLHRRGAFQRLSVRSESWKHRALQVHRLIDAY
ncbi:glycosyltransferase family 1 protein [Alginatibacterium sediminis]|uniref:Glycosyltransferase family 1 protein n=1 Tax=Alginatibacterium sediminis TaxID=2164068 RepID=A0A420EDS0_9ALTE|nr:glycosyltransferase [Alginatibacterium sediminis]RKF18794.1 glycosyltransferase family 1 protein [Alginatibacterium sediminis]